MFDFLFNALFIIVPVFIAVIFVVTIVMAVSPKFRGKLMGRQIKAAKYMLNDVQDDLVELGSVAAKTKQKMIHENEDVLKDIATRSANVHKEGIEITAKAIKDGLSDATIYCKHCGTLIDEDSAFCKKCGKKL